MFICRDDGTVDMQRSERCELKARGGSNPLPGTQKRWRNWYTLYP